MVSPNRPEFSAPYTDRRSTWSAEEKRIARKAFDAALKRELEDVIQEARRRAASITQPSQLWELEDYLTRRRREIDRTCEYRYSVLLVVFAMLIRQGRLREQDLLGLSEDKLHFIRQCARP